MGGEILSMPINTAGPQRVAHEEEKKGAVGLPAPVTRDTHIPWEPYNKHIYSMNEMSGVDEDTLRLLRNRDSLRMAIEAVNGKRNKLFYNDPFQSHRR